jgi:hypothetical protein
MPEEVLKTPAPFPVNRSQRREKWDIPGVDRSEIDTEIKRKKYRKASAAERSKGNARNRKVVNHDEDDIC